MGVSRLFTRVLRKSVVLVAAGVLFVACIITVHLPLPTALAPNPCFLPTLSVWEEKVEENEKLAPNSHKLLAGKSSYGLDNAIQTFPSSATNETKDSLNTVKVRFIRNNDSSASLNFEINRNNFRNKSEDNVNRKNGSSVSINTFDIENVKNISMQDGVSSDPSKHKPGLTLTLDWSRRWVRPWEADPECGVYRIAFTAPCTLTPRALASYPGSGNTWTRQLLQEAGGVFTGSVYRDQQLQMSGYLGELEAWDSGTTLTQKTHQCDTAHIHAFNGSAILLLRNPYRAILAYHNYLFGGHTGFAPVSNYRRKDWGAFVHLQTRTWLGVAVNWTRLGGSVHVIHYELLRQDPITHLTTALSSCGITPDPHRLTCLMKHTSPGFRRRPEYIPEGLRVFSEADRDKLDRAVRYVDYLLRQHHHTPLPLHLYHFYNNTPSQMLEVKCLPHETTAQCDERVDRLNHSRRAPGSRPVKQSVGGTLKATEASPARGNTPQKQDPLHRFVSTKVGWLLTRAFTGVMRAGQEDPIKRFLAGT